MRVYISGKIGEEVISDATRQKFNKAEVMLKAKGFDTFNPTNEKWQSDLQFMFKIEMKAQPHGDKVDFYSYALLRDMKVMATCDAIYFLEDWDKSNGANTEMSFAMATGKKMLWQNLEDAQSFRNDDETADDVWLPIV